jgi:Ca-activated chloride channel homolog
MTTANALIQNNRQHRSSLVSVDGRTYPLKSANLSTRAEGGIAATILTQTYENPYKETLEVLYTLPLPADGAVTGYVIRLGSRVIRGEVMNREAARDEYRKAMLDGRTAALLEQERADTFSQRLGSLPPGETAIVEIEVLQPLAFLPATQSESAHWEYRFPTVTGVRYEGDENRVPDAEALDMDRVGEGLPVRLEAKVLIADGPANNLRPYSPHQQLVIGDEGNATSIALDKSMPLNRDLVIRWAAGSQNTGVRVVDGKGLPCDNGRYILITLTPPNAAQPAIARDLTLLIDASGSMSGEPIEQAKTVAAEMLRSLDPGDRFEIFAFANDIRPLVSGPVNASEENVGDALNALRKLRAGGATEMTKALVEALKPLRPGSQRQIVLLSDGYIGFESEIIGEILSRLVRGARVHVVGVGSAPNRTLTRGVARAGRGVELIIGLEEDAGKAAERLLQATVHPVLTDLQIDGSCLISCAPKKPRDVFAGQPALIFTEVKPEGGTLRISGNSAGSPNPWSQILNIPPLQEVVRATNIPIGALFGREAIEDVEIELPAAKNHDRRGIELLGLRHGITSSMTSLIAISEDVIVDPRNPRRRERLPVEVPAGLSAEGAGLIPRSAPLMGGGHHILSESQVGFAGPFYQSRAFSKLDSSIKGWSDDSMQPTVAMTVIEDARVLRFENQVLVVEFEAPADKFLLPGSEAKVSVLFEDGRTSTATVLERDSSKRGPHRKGLTIRLSMRIMEISEAAIFPETVSWSLSKRLAFVVRIKKGMV